MKKTLLLSLLLVGFVAMSFAQHRPVKHHKHHHRRHHPVHHHQ